MEQRVRAKAEGLLDDARRVQLHDEVAAGRLDPWSAADEILRPLEA